MDDDNNPFADTSIRQATAQTFTNQQSLNEYNPFSSNATVPARPIPAPQPTVAAPLPPEQPAYQPPTYASITTPIAAQQPTARAVDNNTTKSTRVDLSNFERQQAELEQREKRLTERERELRTAQGGHRDNNFPPLPAKCPCSPCFYQDISVEIPGEFQIWVRYLFYLWIVYSITLGLNIIGALSYMVVDKAGAVSFGLSLLYFVLFVPASYACWFRPIYRAFRTDRSTDFMIFFFIFFFQTCASILMTFGWRNSGFCGFLLMIKLFAAGGKSIGPGIIVMIVTICFALIAVADFFLLIKVHKLYRQTGATLEQAQREFQTAFVNNPTVRGAAQEVATAGFNEAMSGQRANR